MTYEEFQPPAELSAWVAVFWRISSEVEFELRVPPDGCMDLIRGDVVGSLSGPLTATFLPGDISQGIRFHPGGFPALFGIPASELVDLRVPLRAVAPRFRSLRALAAAAPPPDPLARATYRSAAPAHCCSEIPATASASSAGGSSPPPATARSY